MVATPPRICEESLLRCGDIFQRRHGIEPVLWRLRYDGVRDAVLRIDPKGRRDLEAAGQRFLQASGDVAFAQAELLGEHAVDVDLQLRVGRRLLDARVGDAGNARDLFDQSLGVVAVLILVWAEHLNIDRRRQAEVEDLRNDVGGQEGERCAGETARQRLPVASSRSPSVSLANSGRREISRSASAGPTVPELL